MRMFLSLDYWDWPAGILLHPACAPKLRGKSISVRATITPDEAKRNREKDNEHTVDTRRRGTS